MGVQPALPLLWPVSYLEEAYIVADCNEAAFRAVKDLSSWISPVLIIIGPEGSGKTHLANIFSQLHSPITLKDSLGIAAFLRQPGPSAVIDDADKALASQDLTAQDLFHTVNDTSQRGGRLLLLASKPPLEWAGLPDLLSRLNAGMMIHLDYPDDIIIKAAYRKMFTERGLLPDDKVLDYLTLRSERSFAGISQIVQALDKVSLEQTKKITIPLIQAIHLFPQD